MIFPSTVSSYELAMPLVLRDRYAMSGTDIAYAAQHSCSSFISTKWRSTGRSPVCLRARYAMSGARIVYGPIFAMSCPVLTWRMVPSLVLSHVKVLCGVQYCDSLWQPYLSAGMPYATCDTERGSGRHVTDWSADELDDDEADHSYCPAYDLCYELPMPYAMT
eukprot:137562-Rhodomonas_salina.2